MSEKDEKQQELIAKHQGQYIPVSTIEHHYLPYELQLSRLSPQALSRYSPYDFLFKATPGTPPAKLELPGLKDVCDTLSDNENGELEYDTVIKTVNKKITTITGKSLSSWQRGAHAEDALKTTFLLFQLHKIAPMGLDILSKEGDSRLTEIELFSCHHKPINKKEEFDHIMLLSAWIKEFFCKALYHRSEAERGVLKNLDLIHRGYTTLYTGHLKTGNHPGLLREEIFNRDPVDEDLSTTLMRKYRLFTRQNNLKIHSGIKLVDILSDPDTHTDSTALKPVDSELAEKSSVIFAKYLLKECFKLSRPEDYTETADKYLQSYSELICEVFKDVLSLKGLSIKAKKVGSRGSHRTSVKETLKRLVENNASLINSPFRIEEKINMDESCDLHFRNLEAAAKWAINNKAGNGVKETASIVQYLDAEKKVSAYIERMTPQEIFDDMERIRNLTMDSQGRYLSVLGEPTGLPGYRDIAQIKEYATTFFTDSYDELTASLSYHLNALRKLKELELPCAPNPAMVIGHITRIPMKEAIKEAAWIIFDRDNPLKSDFLDLWPPSENPNSKVNREHAQRTRVSYVVADILETG